MLTHPTLEQLRALKLDGMVEAFTELQAQDAATDLSHAEWLGLLVEREIAARNTRRFQTRMRSAKLRHIGAAIEDVDFKTPRKLDRALFQQLATGRWIREARNLLITGPCGVGKTWLACALGQRAAATTAPSSTSGCRGSSPISNSPTVTAASRACSAPS
ncbi:IstB-like ATP binding protein [Cereibacter azotoformans]|uniref:IstB-like ATP binding protein n=1 Tax=Cereibacter azotoformans TaxID=43057 RepID=A0A2T5JSX5_9RHOB|nr:IstB-like ATP binding protein [Cereibacter azotoformans]